MFRGILGAAAVAFICAPASAKTITVLFGGTVTSQVNPGIDPLVRLGDRITATFTFDPATQERYYFSNDPNDLWFTSAHPASFRIETSRGIQWFAVDDFNDDGVVLHYSQGVASFSAFLWRVGTVTVPVLRVDSDGSFTIRAGDGSYANLTPSLGFGGTLTRVPEPSTWALMILGFGLAGFKARGASLARARSRGQRPSLRL
jgi:hypothetical protein